MQCPHCDQPLSEQTCPHCDASLLDTGPFCSYCGKRRAGAPAASDEFDSAADADESGPAGDAESIDWDQRVLCSDGNCIGVIGPDGRCKECGKPLQDESTA
ncbi:MAG TPA: hypothetical protein DCZ69_13805 [Syntrophobacteraceae bacterium]|nr:hypothetical protein [Syntrophobacteraceae bacterium]